MRLIASALPAELRVAKEIFEKKQTFFLHTWMWNYKTIYSLMNFLEAHSDVTEVIFVGICGRCVGEEWTNKDKELCIQIANVVNAHTGKEIIVPVVKPLAPLKTILSSEAPVHSLVDMKWHAYVDMESWWVAFVCEKKSLPLTICRVPFDEVGTTDCQVVSYEEALDTLKTWLLSLSLR